MELQGWYMVRLAFWKGASEAVLNHVTSMQQMIAQVHQEGATVLGP